MTPKEKANELVIDFHSVSSESIYYGIDWLMAKQCALIAVDEILKISSLSGGWQNGIDMPLNDRQRQYWEEVKQEIEKL